MNFNKAITEYNTKYFNGLLSNVPVFTYQRSGGVNGKFRTKNNQPSILINTKRTRTENEYRSTLLHEMVHAFLFITSKPRGHSPYFKTLLKSIYTKEFGFTPTTNVRFAIEIKEPKPIATTPKYKVVSSGLIGELISESIRFGKKHLTLKIEGKMFPFTIEAEQAVRV